MKYLPKLPIFLSPFLLIFILNSIKLYQNDLLKLPYLADNIWLILGAVTGYLILNLDRLVDIYFANPDSKLAVVVKDYIAEKNWRNAFLIIKKNKHLQTKLTFHSAVFQVIWVFLAFFTLSSTSSIFGKAFVLGLGFHLLLQQWNDYLIDKNYLKTWLFWQINKTINLKELRTYLLLMTGITTFFFIFFLYL